MADFHDALPFPKAAEEFLEYSQMRVNLRRATSTIRERRSKVVLEKTDFQELRAAAAAIKDSALGALDVLLEQLEANVTAAGGCVHFAGDSDEANNIVLDILERLQARQVVKVKSMTTCEIGLNNAMEEAGIKVVESDLAELIVQLDSDLPSHIVVPAIHRNRAEIRRIFLEQMGKGGSLPPSDLSDDPVELASAARAYLRGRFFETRVAVSGANFAIAENGAVVVVESEGNGRMCVTLPEVLISVIGIDKVIPRFTDLEVFLQLLARSATGERMSPYTSIWRGVCPGDGPSTFHLVVLDNGRSAALRDRVGRQALRCIRCAACLNVCPVYERVGGHAYGSVYPGPIGAVLTPQLLQASSVPVTEALPFASTLCGACAEVCPVNIDIPRILVHLRSRTVEQKRARGVLGESIAMATAGAVLSSPKRLEVMERLGAWSGALIFRKGRIRALPVPLNGWTTVRDAPLPARRPFRMWWRLERGAETSSLDVEGYASRKVVKLRSDSDVGIGHALRALAVSVSGCVRRISSGELQHSREDVIEAVRRSLRDVPMAPVVIPRGYIGVGEAAIKDPTDLFVERFLSYRGQLSRASPSTLSNVITKALRKEGSKRIVVPIDIPNDWLPLGGEFAVDRDDGSLTARELDERDAAIVGCSLAIAETGTVVLDSGARQGRRALSLVPDHLVVVVRSDQVVPGVPDAVRRLSSDRNQTWISGPSATVDIELTRVEGVHGPRKLEVVLVERQRRGLGVRT